MKFQLAWFICLAVCDLRCCGYTMSLYNYIGNYSQSFRESVTGSPTDVYVSLYLHSIEIDDIRQVIGVTCELNLAWKETRLRHMNRHNDVVIHGESHPEMIHRLWRPDIAVVNGLPSTKKQDDGSIRIRYTGEITWTQKLYIEFPCDMKFESYPLDKHECKLRLQSTSFYENEVMAYWSKGYEIEMDKDELHITPRFKLASVSPTWTSVASRPEVKRQLIAVFKIESVSGWTTKHTVLPFVAAVTTAYLAFFINAKGVSSRLLICGIAMIMASIFHQSTYRNVPKTSYTMGLEIFTGTCLTFIWIAAVETVIVEVLSNFGRHSVSLNHTDHQIEHDEETKTSDVSMWVDRIFRVVYPLAFIAFNVVHWIVYS